MKRELRHAGVEELANRMGSDEKGDAAVGGMFLTLNQALFDEPVNDAGDGAVRKADGFAELFEAQAAGSHERGHDEPLRAGEIAAGKLCLQSLAHVALDDIELTLGVLSEGTEFGRRAIVLLPSLGAFGGSCLFCSGSFFHSLDSMAETRLEEKRNEGAYVLAIAKILLAEALNHELLFHRNFHPQGDGTNEDS